MWAKQGPPQNVVDEVMTRIGVKDNINIPKNDSTCYSKNKSGDNTTLN